MRRGHPGNGGWRNENPRHFRSRGHAPPHFGPSRPYSLLDTPVFPPSTPRPHRPLLHYNNQPDRADNHRQPDHHDRSKYRINNTQRNDRGHQDTRGPRLVSNYQPPHHNIHQNSYESNFYMDANVDSFHVNSLGDVDHRQSFHGVNNHSYNQPSPWANPPDHKKQYYEDRSPLKGYKHHDNQESNRLPTLDYGGHRPPASDHYGTPSTVTNNNDTSFSRSVDDTVDIVRRRLMSRSEPQTQDTALNQSCAEQETMEQQPQPAHHEQPIRRRTPRQRQTVKSNCDQMKSNIVQQLFKMDKGKIHKLMDNPNSSTKFEYAISSLITESQNSLNRHLRSVAEKSLCSTSTDFIEQDNNTIYEDTFMKQMQCILDPQDTVFLEDIKPIVMAELSKLLQIDNYDQRFEMSEELNPHQVGENSSYPYHSPHNYENMQDPYYDQNQMSNYDYEHTEEINAPSEVSQEYYNNKTSPENTKRLFERRTIMKDHSEEKKLSAEQRRISFESQRQRRSSEQCIDEPLPLFDTNDAQFSEDEDTFAELDRQYHVAVDHNFIADDIPEVTPDKPQSSQNLTVVKKEIENQIFSLAKSPINLFSSTKNAEEKTLSIVKQECAESPDFPKENTTPSTYSKAYKVDHVIIKQENLSGLKETERSHDQLNNSSNIIKTSPSDCRKRSIDQRPSHRKEKRKKSESHTDSKSAAEKNTDINNSNKCTEKSNDTHKSYYSIFSPKNSKDSAKDYKKDTVDKGYTEKYAKRKDSQRRSKERDSGSSRSKHSSSSSHNNLSPKDHSNKTPTKTDSKTKLKSIDLFIDHPKKGNSHHRSTAASTPAKSIEEPKPKVLTPAARKAMPSRSVSTQVFKKQHSKETQTILSKNAVSRFSQTERKKQITRFAQTDPVNIENKKIKSTDAFERMKEIDMEIQVLLQEKFKLYSSLESKETCSRMPTLGMTVLNVTPVEEIKEEDDVESENLLNADSIVDDFTNIPVEELEQIALESVQEENIETKRPNKRQKLLHQGRKNSESPKSRRSKKSKTPNISLLEQIITDDRPLEEIISLDDYEKPRGKSKKKPRSKPKKKSHKKSKLPKKQIAHMIKQSHKDLKECSVVLVQMDIKKYLRSQAAKNLPVIQENKENDTIEIIDVKKDIVHNVESTTAEIPCVEIIETSKDEPIVVLEENDLQFDMLDVSEDITIGESCEIKSQDDKDAQERVDTHVSEDLILDNSQSTDDVFCSEVQTECKMYDYFTDENLRRDSITVTGNSDAVLAIECLENGFIAACLDGNVYHFSGEGQLLNTMRGSSLAVTCLTIVKENHGTTIYTGSLDSRIRYYDLETGLEKGPECNVLSPIQTMDRAWDTVFVGTRTGFVLQFECKNNMLIPVSTVKFSEHSILALRAMKEGPRKVLLVAARSEDVMIKDAQTGLLLRTLQGPKMSVYTLLFEDGKVYCGTSSNQIHVYDYANGMHTGCHEGGKGTVCLRATGGLLFAGCYDGCVYVYREGETRPLAQFRGPGHLLLSLAVIGSKIIAGYKDRGLYIWKIPLSILQEMIL